MQPSILIDAQRFKFDGDRLAKFLFERGDDTLGFDTHHEAGFAPAVVSRFRDANEAEAIVGPPEFGITIYALDPIAVILAVRERDFREGIRWPLRQLATFSFDVDEIACHGDDSFRECCAAIKELVRRANALLPGLAALVAAEV